MSAAPSDLDLGGLPGVVSVGEQRRARLRAAGASAAARTETQAHGYRFQTASAYLLGLKECEDYTGPVDAVTIDPATGELYERWSMKTARYRGPVYLGSLLRNATVAHALRMVVGFWQRRRDNTIAILALWLPEGAWRALFPEDTEPFLAPAAFAGISNRREDDAAWRDRRKGLLDAWREQLPAGSPIVANYKRDHKRQKRVQCSIAWWGIGDLALRYGDDATAAQLAAALDQ